MANRRLAWLSPTDPPASFPPVDRALDEPDGLLAAGGDLSPARLLNAYPRGIFPWYDSGQPILWWSPDPRCIIRPAQFRLARRMLRELRLSELTVTFNRGFADVIAACAGPRRKLRPGTWITPDMQAAYQELHALGWAHSVEIWRREALVGGVYGLAIGRAFFGESMFSRESNASKFALHALCRALRIGGFAILDCQTVSRHLLALGAVTMPRRNFVAELGELCSPPAPFDGWPAGPVPLSQLSPLDDDAALQ